MRKSCIRTADLLAHKVEVIIAVSFQAGVFHIYPCGCSNGHEDRMIMSIMCLSKCG